MKGRPHAVFSSIDEQAVKVCPVNVIAFVNLSAHPSNEELEGGKKWVRKYFYN